MDIFQKAQEDALLEVRQGGFFRELADREQERGGVEVINHHLFFEALDALEQRVIALEQKLQVN